MARSVSIRMLLPMLTIAVLCLLRTRREGQARAVIVSESILQLRCGRTSEVD
jgi:hypothetical protein